MSVFWRWLVVKSLGWQAALLCIGIVGALCVWALPNVFPGSTVVFALLWGALMTALHRRCLAYLRRSALRNTVE